MCSEAPTPREGCGTSRCSEAGTGKGRGHFAPVRGRGELAVPSEPGRACALARGRSELGQATVEAAALLPVAMLLLAMLLQPAFLLYTRAVMQQAASEGARVLMTREAGGAADDEACEAYVLRRLAAVPDVPAFHTGGREGWEVELAGDASSDEVSVSVTGRLRPLPLVGVLAHLLGKAEGDEVVLEVTVAERARPAWLEGGYGDWVSMWGGS